MRVTLIPALGVVRDGIVVTTPSVTISEADRSAARASGSAAASADSATVLVAVDVENSGDAPVSGASVAVSLARKGSTSPIAHQTVASLSFAPRSSRTVNVTLTLVAPVALWSPENPALHVASVRLSGGDAAAAAAAAGAAATIDVTFGVREFSFDASSGFVINGAGMKLKGGCVHHANGPLGSAAIDAADKRRVQVLKANGYNAIRTSHNPVSPAFLDACDELGVIVMDEAFDCWCTHIRKAPPARAEHFTPEPSRSARWEGKNTRDYHLWFTEWWQRDVTSMVRRDRNHASILMWSIGNEIPGRATDEGYAYARNISDFIRRLDAGGKRALTSAYPGVDNKADQYFAALDVAGYNYADGKYSSDHARVPDRVMVGTESFPDQTAAVWGAVMADPWVVGDFIWTAIDYIGESSIGGNGHNAGGASEDFDACGGYCTQPYPYHVSFCCDIDLVGHRKPQSYLRAVLWGVSPLEMAVHAPVAPDEQEVILSWGFADERQSWTWRPEDFTAARTNESTPLAINVYADPSTTTHVGLT